MIVRRVLLVLCFALLPISAFAIVGADMGVTATDAPDPVAPDGNITYTVHVTNAGPATATTAHLNVFNSGSMLFQSIVTPAGWNCGVLTVGSGASFTCTAITLAAGANDTITIVMNAPLAQQGVLDHTISQLFTVNATESDPNGGNNSVTATTSYVAPHVDMATTGSDSPDPVNPDGNITYTVNVINNGPDVATSANFNAVLNGTLLVQSITAPAGWTCPALAVGFGGSFTCTATNLAVSTSTFTVVLKAGVAQFGVTNQTINQLFGSNSPWFDPNHANDNVTISTSYVAPHTDMQTTATDSPDPVAPDGNITYTVTVTNAGPDPAQNAVMSVVLNNTLRYQSITVPAGWSCPSLAVGHGASFSCTAPTFAASATSVFTVVLNAGSAQFGALSQTINQVFGSSNQWFDTNNANNNVTVPTLYQTSSVNLGVTASDAPDPVSPDGNITYTVDVTNSGPDAGTNVNLNVPLNNTLRFQSLTAPAGWSCPSLAVGSGASFTCTAASLAVSSTSTFTIVLKAGLAQFANTNQTITQNFTVSSGAADPNNLNNSVSVPTSYVVPTANLAVTNSDAPDPVNSGATITYTQTLTNNGPDAAANAKIVEVIGSGATFQSVNAPAGFSCTTPAIGGTGTITCSIASMPNGATASFTIVANVTAVSGAITNTVSGSSDAFDSALANNNAVATTTVTPPPSADLGITKSTATTSAAPGATVSYTIIVTNHGPDAATSVTMTDTLPATLKFASISTPAGFSCSTPAVGATGTITCTAASLANSATATFTLGVTSLSNAVGTIVNTASVSGTPGDSSSGNNSAGASFLSGSADLVLGSTGTQNGATITYTFTVTNNGPDSASSAVFTDALPSSLRFGSITAPGWSCTTPPVGSTGTITCTAASLGTGATGIFTIVTTVAPGATGTLNNSGGVSSATSDPNSGNSSTSAPAFIAAPSDVPALSTWALLLLAAILGAGALMKMR
ncbi:MAG: hypothetical protein QOK37_1196 [Thermoanaerobaculia bacterium]|jgi:uncharacterized repeat protein (TIGR01451 family)|nr:hypothetical protein [Thermoanaerobaculia bacterium]